MTKFIFEKIGYNLEGSEIGAAFGLVQLENLENNIKTREDNFENNEFFKNYEEFIILPKQTENTKTGWLAFPIIIKEMPFKEETFKFI